MKLWGYILVLFMGGLFGWLLSHYSLGQKTNTIIKTDTIYSTKIDTIQLTKINYKYIYVPKIDTLHVFDTIKLIRTYFSTLEIDTSMLLNECYISLNEQITENRVKELTLYVKNNRATQISNVIQCDVPKWYGSAAISTNGSNTELWVGAGYLHKKNLYTVEYGGFSKSVKVGVMISF